MKLSIVVARARNGVIGHNNELPWHLPEDLKYFKSITMGKPLIMGRKTWESIGRPLPGRTSIVVTSRSDWFPDGALVVHSLQDALDTATKVARAEGGNEIMVIGGSEIYRQLLPQTDRLYLTEVDADVEGDAYFPHVDLNAWREVKRLAGTGSETAYAFVVLERHEII